ncbi:hypothetical protein HK405_009987, partial [Cladochytrium tenue]
LTAANNIDPFLLARQHSSTGGGFVGTGSSVTGVSGASPVVCTAVVVKPASAGEYCFRAQTQWTYLEGNRNMARHFPDGLVSDSVQLSQKTAIGNNSMVGEGTRIGERTSIKKTIVGSHCVIGKNVSISGSVVMDHCIIEDK